jgi:hypothetical protein
MKKRILIFSTIIVIFFGVGFALSQGKAILYMVPASGSFNEGSTININVKINSNGNVINSAQGILTFPKNKLEVLEVKKDKSIFSFWDPTTSFSNHEGKITFGGGLPSPGFSGIGNLCEIIFRAKEAGSASVQFTSGSVMTNSNKAVDVLGKMDNVSFSINKLAIPVPKKKPTFKNLRVPKIVTYQDNISSTEVFYIEGISEEEEAVIILYIEKQNQEPTVEQIDVTSDGSWSYVAQKFLQPGQYLIYAKAKNKKGEISPPSNKINLTVTRGGMTLFGNVVSNEVLLTIVILILIVAIFVMFGYLLYSQKKNFKRKLALTKELKEAYDSIVNGFIALKKEITKEIKELQSLQVVDVSSGERVKKQNLIDDLIQDIDLIDKIQNYIQKEVKDIESVLPSLN